MEGSASAFDKSILSFRFPRSAEVQSQPVPLDYGIKRMANTRISVRAGERQDRRRLADVSMLAFFNWRLLGGRRLEAAAVTDCPAIYYAHWYAASADVCGSPPRVFFTWRKAP